MKRWIHAATHDIQEIDSEGNLVPYPLADKLKHSLIRNKKQQLRVCYHGTLHQFEHFKKEFIATNSGNIGWFGKGFYFTNNPKIAQSYGKNVKKAYLNITNPFIYSSEDSIYELLSLGVTPRVYEHRLQPYAYLDDEEPIEVFTEAIKNAGYDGVQFSYRQGKYKSNISGSSNSFEFVCFYPEQIYLI